MFGFDDFDRRARMTRRQAMAGSAGLVLSANLAAAALRAPPAARGFDFLIGHWTVRHRRLKARLSGSRDWEEFPGTLDVQPILHGLGNADKNVLEDPRGTYFATSLRVFSPKTGLWSIYWVDGRGSGIDKPVIGAFEGRTGRFYNDDELNGAPIKVRFTYRDLGVLEAGWEQAFSVDGGKSWETNWTMEFSRKKKA
jgi:hypothetical protein